MKIPIIHPGNRVKWRNEHQTGRLTRPKFEYFLSYWKNVTEYIQVFPTQQSENTTYIIGLSL